MYVQNKNITFFEYIKEKLKYFLHGKAPESVSYDAMFEHYYNVEPAMIEVMFLYFILQGREQFYKAKTAFDNFTNEKGIHTYLTKENYPIFKKFYKKNIQEEVKQAFDRDRKDLNKIFHIIQNLSNEQYETLIQDATQDYMVENLGFPLRYGKLAYSWKSKNLRKKSPTSKDLCCTSLHTFVKHYNYSVSQLMNILESKTGINQSYFLDFYNGKETSLTSSNIHQINRILSNLRQEQERKLLNEQ